MKKTALSLSIFISLLCVTLGLFAQDYTTTITFPANYQVGDYTEFVVVSPSDAGASGYYEVSISYTRGNVAAAATHLASISHANPNLWREVGRVANNPYVSSGNYNFTIDCNTQSGYPRFRIRAVNTLGVATPLPVNVKVRSINFNAGWTPINITGNDLTVNKFLPMTNEWNLYVGSTFSADGASLAIKAIENGNVGIGIATPDQKLSVNGTIHSKKVLVDLNGWSDYVFKPDYKLPGLNEVKAFIDKNQHLPDIPSESELEKTGIDVTEIMKLQMKKIEELTLYLIKQKETTDIQQKQIEQLKGEVHNLIKTTKP